MPGEITSADPEDLGRFVDGGERLRRSLQDDRDSLASLQTSVLAGCGGAHQIAPAALEGVSAVLFSMSLDENMVAGVRDALVAADRSGAGGVVSAPTGDVIASLQSAGVTENLGPIHVEPGIFLGVPPTSGFVDDPICAANGNFVHVDHDLVFPGWSAALDVVRVHNSLASDRVGAFGPGWTSVLDLRVVAQLAGVVRVHLADGAVVPFVDGGDGVLRSVGGRGMWLEPLGAGEGPRDGWVLHEGHTKRWTFDAEGRFTGGVGGAATLEVRRDRAGRIVEIAEQRSARRLAFTWTDDRVTAIESSDGRRIDYLYDSDGVLVTVHRPTGMLSFGVDGTRVVSVTDADGIRLALNTYDADGRVVEQTNEMGRTTRYEYSQFGTTLVSDTVEGARNAFTHDDRGNLTAIVDGLGRSMRISYDEAGNATRIDDRTGAVTENTFDSRGNLTSRLDPDGLGQRWEWDDLDRLVAETHRNGAVTHYTYEGSHRRPARIVAPDGATIEIELADTGVPVVMTDADGVATRFEYDADGQMTDMVDALGNRSTVRYDAAGHPVITVDAAGGVTSMVNDDAGRLVEAVIGEDPTRFTWTAAGRPLSGRDAEGQAWTATFGANGRIETFTDGEGSTVGYEWDPFGNLETVVAPDGGHFGHVYDSANNLVSASDPAGNTSERTLDGEGRVVAVVDAAGRQWRRELDVMGRTLVSVAPDGARTRYEYHDLGSVARVVHPDGRSVSTELDVCGRVVAVIDETEARFEFEYSPAGRLVERRWPSGRVERFSHDAAGRLVATDSAGGRVELDLDGMGRVVALSSPAGTVRASLSANGDILAVSGPLGEQSFELDRAGRVSGVFDGLGNRTDYEWDRAGRLVSATDPSGMTTAIARDARGRAASQVAPNGDTTAMAYDAAGWLESVTDPTGATSATHRDPSGRTVAVDRPDGSRIDYTLDPVGRTVGMGSGGWFDQTYAYDTLGRLTEAFDVVNRVRTGIERDQAGRLHTVTGPAGTVSAERDGDGALTAWTQNGIRVELRRDSGGRVVGFGDSQLGEISRPESGVSERDSAGRIVACANGSTYRYDTAGRLTESLDRHGQRRDFTYGLDGLLSSETRADGETVYRRGFLGRIDAIVHPDGGESALTYDSLGRRVAIQHADGAVTRYRWDDHDNLLALERVSSEGTTSVHRFGIDALGRPVSIDGTPVLWDDLRTGLPLEIGATRVLHLGGHTLEVPAGAGGEVAPGTAAGGAAADGPAGEITAGTAPVRWSEPLDDPWGVDDNPSPHVGFGGHLAAHGLVWMGARVYDPATREFLSPDPLPAVPGMPGAAGVYSYGFLNPVNYLDPTGMRPVSQAEFDAWRTAEEQGRLGRAWEAIQEDPWGTLAMVGVTAVGVALVATGVGTAVGVGILVGVGMSAGMGIATGNFSPRSVAVSGAFGAIPGAATMRGAVLAGGASGIGEDIVQQVAAGGPINVGSVVQSGLFSMGTAGVMPASASNATDAIPTRVHGATPRVEIDGPPAMSSVVHHGPLDPGPLRPDVASTFRSGTYDAVTVAEPASLYRVHGGNAGQLGPYWTRTAPTGGTQSIIDSALDPQWGNAASKWTEIEVPPGTTLFEGAAAPQRGLVGGGNQVYLDQRVPHEWIRGSGSFPEVP